MTTLYETFTVRRSGTGYTGHPFITHFKTSVITLALALAMLITGLIMALLIR